jgi:hypothetical protein
MTKEIYYDREFIKKSLKRVILIYGGGIVIFIIFSLIKLLTFEVVLPLVGLQIILLGYFYISRKKILNYDKPVLIIYHDHMELSDFNFFMVVKTKSIYYEEIKSIGMDTKQDVKYLSINLKAGKEIKYSIQQLGLDSTSLTKLINEVNPLIKIINYGSFEYN